MLPPLYAGWMDELLGAPIPEEREAACETCVMRQPAGAPPEPGAVYFTEGKCCTYQPQLHCFLMGRILADGAADLVVARAAVERLLDARAGVTPLGIMGPRSYWALYDYGTGFGRSSRLRCPLFDVSTGRCGVWRHRESTCATWFCKHDRGAVGEAFWTALHQLLMQLERSLARWCMVELAVGTEALAAASARELSAGPPDTEDLDGGASAERYRRAWGRWLGREREYYRECAGRVDGLAWPEVLALGGAEARALAEVARRRFEELRSHELPGSPLRIGRFEVASVASGFARLRSYRDFDPVDVPLPLLAALPRFDGRPTEQVAREIAERDGVEIPTPVLRTLADFKVLVPEGSRTASDRGDDPRCGEGVDEERGFSLAPVKK
jgi:Fe-S-cluster containining protein